MDKRSLLTHAKPVANDPWKPFENFIQTHLEVKRVTFMTIFSKKLKTGNEILLSYDVASGIQSSTYFKSV